jgi:hypothetical protein
LEDLGERPLGFQLERRNNNGNYTKSNCCWASRKDQAKNRRTNLFLTYNGKKRILAEWVVEFKLSSSTINHRLKRGWKLEKALITPKLYREKLTSKEILSIDKLLRAGTAQKSIARKFNISPTVISKRQKELNNVTNLS